MEITLKQITLLNFKGIRSLTVNFNEKETSILGQNASGKTTVFDAFVWLLFGKDSNDHKEFNIKTLGKDGKPIERIPHEVSALLVVNGTELSLRKTYSEKWTKKRGSAVEEFTGHEVTQFVNDVPCGTREYQSKIDAICTEQVFKMITNPLYFPAQKKEMQRQTLISMVGDITNSDMAELKPEFADLVAQLSGKSVEEYKREISAKKRKVKDELDQIPGRIDERKRDMPESEDWKSLQAELEDKRKMVEDIDNQISDRAKAQEEIGKKRIELINKINNLKANLRDLEYSIKDEATKEYRELESKRNGFIGRLSMLRSEENAVISVIEQKQQEISRLIANREKLLKEWQQIKAETIQFNENEFVCPTCNRPFDIDDIEKKQAELTANFNTNKANMLDENKRKGLLVKQSMGAAQDILNQKQEQLALVRNEIQEIEAADLYKKEPSKPDAINIVSSDARVIELNKKIAELQRQQEKDNSGAVDILDLQDGKKVLSESIDELRNRLAKKTIIEANNRRISELEREAQRLSQELADLESMEFVMADFAKTKIQQVEGRINSLFSIVTFKMYESQINGGEVETCEAMVDGVPFSDLNTAAQINAGLDIINAICRHNKVHAPIFVDNAESVNQLLSTDSQLVRLVVTTDPSLIIK